MNQSSTYSTKHNIWNKKYTHKKKDSLFYEKVYPKIKVIETFLKSILSFEGTIVN